MPAYAIFIRENTRDQDAMDTYLEQSKGTGAPFNARPLAYYGRTKTLEGPPAHAVVLAEFPAFEEAEVWYASERYQKAKRHRHLGADYRAIIVEGL